jgi:hypothetical protein
MSSPRRRRTGHRIDGLEADVQDRREGRRWRTGAVLVVSAVLILGAAAAAVTLGVRFVLHRPPQVVGKAPVIARGAMVEHWGAFGKQVDPHLSPVSLALPARVAEIGSSNSAQYALLANGAVYAWGVSYATVACGGATCYGVTGSGAVYAWGQGTVGEVGNGLNSPARRPVKIKTSEVTGISATAEDVAVRTTAA